MKTNITVDKKNFKTNYKFVFVHGLSGWGSYDSRNKHLKYWGMFTGDLLKYLNGFGFDCYSASVDPTGSAWDRACELYAQLTGSVVDYGKEHSERCNHARFGTDFSTKPLVDKWDSENKVNLIGHSFGGATVRMLCELLLNGSEAERNATDGDDISPLFLGGKGDWVHSVTALASPHNGTTAYDIDTSKPLGTDLKSRYYDKLNSTMASAVIKEDDGRADYDNANFDMFIDNALKLNNKLSTLENAYYFSFPCNSSLPQKDGTYYPEESITEAMFFKSGVLMGRLTETTAGGFTVGEDWLMNDGLVNTVSAFAPIGAPQKHYAEGEVNKGEWNIMPIYHGDHMSLQGGMKKKNDVREFFLNHLKLINSLD